MGIFFLVPLADMKNFVRHSEIIFASYPCDVNNYMPVDEGLHFMIA